MRGLRNDSLRRSRLGGRREPPMEPLSGKGARADRDVRDPRVGDVWFAGQAWTTRTPRDPRSGDVWRDAHFRAPVTKRDPRSGDAWNCMDGRRRKALYALRCRQGAPPLFLRPGVVAPDTEERDMRPVKLAMSQADTPDFDDPDLGRHDTPIFWKTTMSVPWRMIEGFTAGTGTRTLLRSQRSSRRIAIRRAPHGQLTHDTYRNLMSLVLICGCPELSLVR